jgi:hypothetical protein
MQRLVAPVQSAETGDEWDPMQRIAGGRTVAGRRADDVGSGAPLRPLIAGAAEEAAGRAAAGIGDRTYEEIGRMLKIPVGTVKWRCRKRARC